MLAKGKGGSFMIIPVTRKFTEYLKYLLDIRGVSTRELSRSLGKSPSYVSHILSGKIKSIEHETAEKMLKIIYEKSKTQSGDIVNNSFFKSLVTELLRTEQEPKIGQQMLEGKNRDEQMIREYEKGKEEIDKILNLLMDKLILEDNLNVIYFIEKIINNEKLQALCYYALTTNKSLDVLLAVGEILYADWGVLSPPANVKPDFKRELENLLVKYGYIEEHEYNGVN